MSLAVLANHMASKGRHGDDMLVHMSKDEVAALQRLAESHGLTLTINPETGMPEAFSLKSLLGVVAPLLLTPILGPAGAAIGEALGGIGATAGTAILTGGISALASGSLEKGLMTGLMSYGLSGLGEGLSKVGAQQVTLPVESAAGTTAVQDPLTIAREAASKQIPAVSEQAENLYKSAPDYGPTPSSPTANAAFKEAITPFGQQQAFSQLPFGEQASLAYKGVTEAPGQFLKDNWKNLAMVGVPAALMLGSQPSLKGVSAGTDPSQVRFPRKRYDPYTGTYEQLPGFTLADYRAGIMSGNSPLMTAADGGIVALADGGVAFEAGNTPSYQRTSTSPGMLDFAQKSEPVVRMADGGVAHFDDGGLSASDQGVFNAYQGMVSSGQITAEQANDRLGMMGINAAISAPVAAAPVAAAPVAAAPPAGLSSLVSPATVAAATPMAAAATEPPLGTPTAEQLGTVTNIYRNVLGRDPDAEGLQYWAGRLAGGESLPSMYNALQGSARTVLGSENIALPTTLATPLSLAQATAPMQIPTGYSAPSTYNTTMADEWMQNVLGRGLTAADTQQSWYKNLNTLEKTADVDKAYADFLKANNVSAAKAPNWFEASRLGALVKDKVIPPTPKVTTGAGTGVDTTKTGTGFDLTAGVGTTTPPIAPVIPGAGPVPTMNEVIDAYTKGGGSLGYIPYAPKTMAELEAKYPLSGASKAAYDYLTGKAGAAYPVVQNVPGGIMKPYWAQAMPGGGPKYTPKSLAPTTTDTTTAGTPTGSWQGVTADEKNTIQSAIDAAKESGKWDTVSNWMKRFQLTKADLLKLFPTWTDKETASFIDKINYYIPPIPEREQGGAGNTGVGVASGNTSAPGTTASPVSSSTAAAAIGTGEGGDNARGGLIKRNVGGIMNLAHGGVPLGVLGAAAQGGQFDLGDYSDGGRLLRGPGDGVSDSIPASIGNKRPARLADGEFVVPARIVSELGNGSTDAGARKLYAMMDRIQARRGKTTGKGRVAVDSRADKSLPA